MKVVKEYEQQYFDPHKIFDAASDNNVTLCGCVHRIRKMTDFAFVIMRTGKVFDPMHL